MTYLALKWLHENAASLDADPHQLFVAGDSAGGGLTAATTLYARDQREVPIAFQMPFYPMLDDRPTPTSRANDAPVWNTNNNQAAWHEYLGNTPSSNVSPYAAPARATDYQGLPPTYTFVGTIEPFYYETMLYVKHLRDAGVKAEIDIYDGAFHAFDQFAGKTQIAQTATAKWQQALKYASKHYFTQNQ